MQLNNSQQDNPWNWPMPSKKDTMYLSTLPPRDSSKTLLRRPSTNLRTQDINQKPELSLNRESTSLKTSDIPHSRPRKLFNSVNRPYNRFTNNDIKGTKPLPRKFKTNRRPTNPLNPQYELPPMPDLEPYEPRFVRDNINVCDIKGTKPRVHIKSLKRAQPTNYVADIVERPRKRTTGKKRAVDSLFTGDINQKLKSKSKRNTNPLDPIYVFEKEKGNKIELGQIESSKPRVLHKELKKEHFNLNTEDIIGAQASTFGNWMLKEKVGLLE